MEFTAAIRSFDHCDNSMLRELFFSFLMRVSIYLFFVCLLLSEADRKFCFFEWCPLQLAYICTSFVTRKAALRSVKPNIILFWSLLFLFFSFVYWVRQAKSSVRLTGVKISVTNTPVLWHGKRRWEVWNARSVLVKSQHWKNFQCFGPFHFGEETKHKSYSTALSMWNVIVVWKVKRKKKSRTRFGGETSETPGLFVWRDHFWLGNIFNFAARKPKWISSTVPRFQK